MSHVVKVIKDVYNGSATARRVWSPEEQQAIKDLMVSLKKREPAKYEGNPSALRKAAIGVLVRTLKLRTDPGWKPGSGRRRKRGGSAYDQVTARIIADWRKKKAGKGRKKRRTTTRRRKTR